MRDTAVPDPTVSDLKKHMGFWLRFVSNHVSVAFARKLQDSGVSVAEWVVMRGGCSTTREISPGVLAERDWDHARRRLQGGGPACEQEADHPPGA